MIQKVLGAYEGGSAPEARRWLAVARQTPPKTGDQALMLGYVSLNLRETAEALHWFTEGVRLSPGRAHAHSSRALALQLHHRRPEARAEAGHALALDPDDPVALKVLTRIHLDEHQTAEAAATCQQVLRLHPDDPDAAAMLKECGTVPPGIQVAPPEVSLPPAPARKSSPQPSTVAPKDAGTVPSETLRMLAGLLGDFAHRGAVWEALGVEHLLHQLVVGDFRKATVVFQKPTPLPPGPDGLPVPPVELTMGYGAGNLDHYLGSGCRSHEQLCRLLQREGV
ncbi:MAG: tetratricopeptide repeat protein, partial [Candidatus Rokubacteria bacterium]|nr:tetratricopeptide repeat protein [Candidatus Rokubacteria bacterium]